MTLAIILVVFSVVALGVILRFALAHSLQISRDVSLKGQIEPIDVAAFRNLVDPDEEEYLRRRLLSGEFRTVQRKRLRAMAAYILTAWRNAGVLISIGQAAMTASDPSTAEAARQMVSDAILLRQNAALALCRIGVALAWPHSGLAAAPVLRGYERLNGSAMLLGRLQNPAAPVRISAT
jgi:hypothetical protein